MKNVNVIRYEESFLDKNHLCIVTEFCEHGDLHSEIQRRKKDSLFYSEDEVMETFVQILMGYVFSISEQPCSSACRRPWQHTC
jgi:serine/threonine protein kinase